MKPDRAPTTALPELARVEFQVQFSTPRRVWSRPPDVTAPTEPVPQKTRPRGRQWGVVPAGRPSRVALLLALAHDWERLVREGVMRDYADIARLAGLTRARVTQIMNLMLLAPDIQEKILFLTNTTVRTAATPEREVRVLSVAVEWTEQQRVWRGLTVQKTGS